MRTISELCRRIPACVRGRTIFVVISTAALSSAISATSSDAQAGSWAVTVAPTMNPLPAGFCAAVRLTVTDATKQVPRNPAGYRVSLADFDMAVSGAGVAGFYDGPNIWSVCTCQGAPIGSVATITATYPSSALAQNVRVKGVLAKASATFGTAKPAGPVNPPACQGGGGKTAAQAGAPLVPIPSSQQPTVTKTPIAPAPSTTTTTSPPRTATTPITVVPAAPSATSTGQLRSPGSSVLVAPASPGTAIPRQGAPGVVPTGFRLASSVPIVATLAWDAMPNAVSYTVLRSDGVGAQPIERVRLTEADLKTTTDVIPDPRVTYSYILVVAYADGTLGQSPPVLFTSPPLVNPAGFSATHVGFGTVDFAWQQVPGAVRYRLDGPGLPNTGFFVTELSASYPAIPAGANSWKLLAMYNGNFGDYANPAIASAVIRILPPHPTPWLTKNNGAGREADVQMPKLAPVECSYPFLGLPLCVTLPVQPNQLQYPFDADYARWIGKGLPGFGAKLGIYQWLDMEPGLLLWDQENQPGNEAVYGNPGDLGVGRRSFCVQKTRTTQIPGVYTVCYATAHGIAPGQPNFNDPEIISRPGELQDDQFLLAMVIAKEPTGTVFMVLTPGSETVLAGPSSVNEALAGYGLPVYKLSPTVTLDTEGPKYVPHACLSCHGGTYNPTTHKVDGASFLPIDPNLQSFAPEADRAGAEEKIRSINNIIAKSGSSPAVVAYINGLYGNSVSIPGTLAKVDFVPSGWQPQAGFYRQVVRPYCATCHLAAAPSWNFASWGNFQNNAALIKVAVCNAHTMPHAEIQFKSFWTKDTGPVYLPGLLATTLGFPSCP